MTSSKINAIIDNFAHQLSLYQQMAELSCSQLACLKNPSGRMEEIHTILDRRQQIMNNIITLNETSRKLQQVVAGEIKLEAFTLSNLRDKVSLEEFQQLQSLINNLGQVLSSINEIDSQSQAIMAELKTGPAAPSLPANPVQAARAYQQVMQKKRIPRE